MSVYTMNKQLDVLRDTARLQRLTEHLWMEPYYIAYRKVTWAAQTDMPWVFIRLPFPFTDEDIDWCEKIAALWAKHGYELRPGGPAGWAQDIIRLDRRLVVPEPGLEWGQDEINGDPDGV